MPKISEHFDSEEFTCKHCGAEVPIDPRLITKLEQARTIVGFPFYITSGYRCPKYNATLEKAVPDSAHTRNPLLGADISCTDGRKRLAILRAAMAVDFTRIGIDKAFIHLDVGRYSDGLPDNTTWLY